jgi:hypothetical protein
MKWPEREKPDLPLFRDIASCPRAMLPFPRGKSASMGEG